MFAAARRVVDARAAVREEYRVTSIEYALDEHPFARGCRATSVDLRRAQDRDGQTAVEQHLLGRDLVGAVPRAGVVVDVERGDRRLCS